MYLGYNTNGFAHHRLDDAIAILADLGYTGIALTVDHHVLNPFDPDNAAETKRIAAMLERAGLETVIETGARFLLDPWRKHQPTLLSHDHHERDCRIDFLVRCIRLAAELKSDAVSFWSGSPNDNADEKSLWTRLTEACHRVIEEASRLGVTLAFEPEPGMFIDTMTRFDELTARLGDTSGIFGLTLDIGHLHCLGETPIADRIHRYAAQLRNIHLDDMRAGVHDHLMLGEGEIDFPPVFHALGQVGYQGGVFIELSRHSHDAVKTARTCRDLLRTWIGG